MKNEQKESEAPQEVPENTIQEQKADEHEAVEIPKEEPTDKKQDSRDIKKKLIDFLHTKKGKIVAVLVAFVVVLGILFAIPASRYAIAGLVIKKEVPIAVTDKTTGKPVSGVQLTLNGQTIRSDGNGKATFYNIPVGEWRVTTKKNYYSDASVSTTVPIIIGDLAVKIALTATGRVVPVSVVNKISGAALANVDITADDSSATTDNDGKATVVVPVGKDKVSATFKLNGYNLATAEITVTEQEDAKNAFGITPSGKIYFLSKRTGKINVMKSDLDGSSASVVVQATGKESDTDTTLLASRDWQYMALKSKRDNDNPKLYFINAADDKLTVIDEGANAEFTPIGWSNEHFIYRVTRTNVPDGQPKRVSIKGFNAKTNKLTTIEDDNASGGPGAWARESIDSVYILNDVLVYDRYWNNSFGADGLLSGKKDVIISVKSDGSDKKTLKEFDASSSSYIQAALYNPSEILFRVNDGGNSSFYEYEDGKIVDAPNTTDASFFDDYPTYLVSPGGEKTFWSEQRDGKDILFVGNKEGEDGKELKVESGYKQYGWYGEDYVLVSKDSSELYIMPRTAADGSKPFKVTDYHKPAFNGIGYGYGYGGF